MKFNSVGATALAAAASLTPVLAQVDIEDLGYCARFYLDENCQNVRPGNPYTDGVYYHDDPRTAEPNEYHYHGRRKKNDGEIE